MRAVETGSRKNGPTQQKGWANWSLKMKLSKELYTRVNRDFERNGLVSTVDLLLLVPLAGRAGVGEKTGNSRY
jgi:hypothetical protein